MIRSYVAYDRVLSTSADGRALPVLASAHAVLEETAALHTEEDLGCSFLDDIAVRWALPQLWQHEAGLRVIPISP